jgi:hypothetical protein
MNRMLKPGRAFSPSAGGTSNYAARVDDPRFGSGGATRAVVFDMDTETNPLRPEFKLDSAPYGLSEIVPGGPSLTDIPAYMGFELDPAQPHQLVFTESGLWLVEFNVVGLTEDDTAIRLLTMRQSFGATSSIDLAAPALLRLANSVSGIVACGGAVSNRVWLTSSAEGVSADPQWTADLDIVLCTIVRLS